MLITNDEIYAQTVYTIYIQGFYEEETSPFIDREQELAKALRFLNPEVNPSGVVITGLGGLGKTRLAFEAARILKHQRDYDEVVSITAKNSLWDISKEHEVKKNRQGKYLYASYGGMINELTSFLLIKSRKKQPRSKNVLDFLKDKRYLFIVDNLDSINVKAERRQIEYSKFQDFVLKLPRGNKAIITTRFLPNEWQDEGMVVVRLTGFDSNSAYQQFISLYPDLPSSVSDQAITQVLNLAHGNPLITRQLVNIVQTQGFNKAIEKFTNIEEHSLLLYIYKSTFDHLSRDTKVVAVVIALATYSVNKNLVSKVTGFGNGKLDLCIEELRRANLIQEDRNAFTVHFLFEEFLANHATGLWRTWKDKVRNVELE